MSFRSYALSIIGKLIQIYALINSLFVQKTDKLLLYKILPDMIAQVGYLTLFDVRFVFSQSY